MQLNTFSILFYPKRNDVNKDGKVPIYMRITIGGKRSELSIQRKVEIDQWNTDAGKVRGTNHEAKSLNQLMDIIKSKVYDHHRDLVGKNIEVTARILKNSYLGIGEKKVTLIEIFDDHNGQLKRLVGKEFALGTLKRYETALRHIKSFLKSQYNLDDMPLKKVNHQFITGFEFYLKSKYNCNQNSAMKYIKNLKKIVRIALANDWIDFDPFLNYKIHLKEVEREFLSKDEVQKMLNREMHIPRLEQVRDIFIFCCYTGLAYADVKKLSKDDVVIGIDGERWIKTKRAKTDTRSNIPILPTAEAIIEKYKENMDVLNGEKLLPVLSNQKMNAYLKEIADLCGITKNLTFHLARHTFATTITLTNGVPIESVSKMLGHKSLKTTQHYAKIIDRKVSDDMSILRSKLNPQLKSENVN